MSENGRMTIEEAMDRQKLVIKNIRFLAKRKGIKIKTIENACGVTIGYLSRCKEKKKITLAIAMVAADILETTIDELAHHDIEVSMELEDIEGMIAELEERKKNLQKENT